MAVSGGRQEEGEGTFRAWRHGSPNMKEVQSRTGLLSSFSLFLLLVEVSNPIFGNFWDSLPTGFTTNFYELNWFLHYLPLRRLCLLVLSRKEMAQTTLACQRQKRFTAEKGFVSYYPLLLHGGVGLSERGKQWFRLIVNFSLFTQPKMIQIS